MRYPKLNANEIKTTNKKEKATSRTKYSTQSNRKCRSIHYWLANKLCILKQYLKTSTKKKPPTSKLILHFNKEETTNKKINQIFQKRNPQQAKITQNFKNKNKNSQ